MAWISWDIPLLLRFAQRNALPRRWARAQQQWSHRRLRVDSDRDCCYGCHETNNWAVAAKPWLMISSGIILLLQFISIYNYVIIQERGIPINQVVQWNAGILNAQLIVSFGLVIQSPQTQMISDGWGTIIASSGSFATWKLKRWSKEILKFGGNSSINM